MGEVMAEVGEIRVDIKTALKAMSTTEIADALSKSIESARRRELVGGLIRYLKDGEIDLGRLLFHYVHVEDYGQAMIEGWGELHKLLTEPSVTIGPFGLSYRDFDFWEQAVMDTVRERALETTPLEDASSIRERITEAGRRVKVYRGGDILMDHERNDIEQIVVGFATAGGLEDLIQIPDAEPDFEPDFEPFTFEEEPDEACDPAD